MWRFIELYSLRCQFIQQQTSDGEIGSRIQETGGSKFDLQFISMMFDQETTTACLHPERRIDLPSCCTKGALQRQRLSAQSLCHLSKGPRAQQLPTLGWTTWRTWRTWRLLTPFGVATRERVEETFRDNNSKERSARHQSD